MFSACWLTRLSKQSAIDTIPWLICPLFVGLLLGVLSVISLCRQRSAIPQAETWRRVWGEREKIGMTPFKKKNSISEPKISDDLFSHLLCFFCLSLLSDIWYITYMALFYIRKTSISEQNIPPWHLFFTQFVLLHASDNASSGNIGVTDTWAVPHLKFFWGRPPSPPKSPPMGDTSPDLEDLDEILSICFRFLRPIVYFVYQSSYTESRSVSNEVESLGRM